jgi:uncharacterized protein YerC
MTPAMTQPTPILIRDMLKEGFGVEDIHVRTGLDLEHVRKVVRGLRHSGELARMFRGAVS